MKYDALQGDFSFGEISPSAQGDVEGIIYKAAAARIINMVPTRTKGVASRAGGKWVADGFNAHTNVADNSPVQHIPLVNSPIGEITIEIGQHGLRFMDAFGVLDWNQYSSAPLLSYDIQDGTNAWADAVTRTVYLSNVSGVGKKQYRVTAPNPFFGSRLTEPNTGFPVGTNEHWVIKGKVAGDLVTIEIRDSGDNLISTSTADGRTGVFSYDFEPLSAFFGLDDFSITFVTINNTASATALWDLVLFKNGTKFAEDLNVDALDKLAPDVNRIRAASFWLSADSPYKGDQATYWVFFAGGPSNQWAGWCLSWTVRNPSFPFRGGSWSFQQVPCPTESLALIKGSSTVTVYQERVIFGNNNAAGRPQLVASCSGFMRALDKELVTHFSSDNGKQLNLFLFKIIKQTYIIQGVGSGGAAAVHQEHVVIVNSFTGPSPGNVRAIRFDFTGNDVLVDEQERFQLGIAAIAPLTPGNAGAPNLTVKYNGIPVKVTPAPSGLGATGHINSNTLPLTPNISATAGTGDGLGLEAWVSYPSNFNNNPAPPLGVGSIPVSAFSGEIFFNDGQTGAPATAFLQVGDVIEFSTIPLAEDPLNLTLASPAGNISFLNVLRGLVMGTTTAEKLFPPDTPFALDPATGSSIIAEDESEQGSDDALNAINVNDKVLFVQLGRKTLRQAYISFATQGGLAAEDIGQMGEHLTGKGIRSFCLLKTPVQRVVFAFDDGSGAIMTLNVNNTQAWSQFTLPAVFGGIYSVAALQTKTGSQLFVGTENGTTLVWTSFESKINNGVTPTLVISQAAPLPPIKIVHDTENAVPPIMDGWLRAAINDDTATQALQLPNSLVGQNMYALVNGNLVGPYPVVANSGSDGSNAITFPVDLDLTTTWVDPSGKKRPQETYVGILYPAHGMTTLGLEGGNPAGTSQGKVSRKAQLYVRFVDSYLPKVNGERPEEIQPGDRMDFLASRVTGDVRCTELEFQRAAVITVDQDLPLRVEISAFFGGTAMNGV